MLNGIDVVGGEYLLSRAVKVLGEGRTVLYGIKVCVKWGCWEGAQMAVTAHTAGFF